MRKPAKLKKKPEGSLKPMAKKETLFSTPIFRMGLSSLCLVASLSACEAIDLINSVGTVLAPSGNPSASPSPEGSSTPNSTSSNNTSPQPVASSAPAGIDVVKANDPVPVSTDWNLARKAGNTLQVSSFKDANTDKSRLLDGALATSWFASDSDVPAQGKLPTVELQFGTAAGVLSINLRGDRQEQKGLLIQELNLLAIGTDGVLANETVKITPEDKDVNLVFKKPLDNVKSLRLTITRSTGTPGLAELEVLGR